MNATAATPAPCFPGSCFTQIQGHNHLVQSSKGLKPPLVEMGQEQTGLSPGRAFSISHLGDAEEPQDAHRVQQPVLAELVSWGSHSMVLGVGMWDLHGRSCLLIHKCHVLALVSNASRN